MLQLADAQEQRSQWKAPEGCSAWPECGKELGKAPSQRFPYSGSVPHLLYIGADFSEFKEIIYSTCRKDLVSNLHVLWKNTFLPMVNRRIWSWL